MAMWWWLGGAIGAEVTATLSLRYAEGFTRLVPSILVVLGYGVAFYALSSRSPAACCSRSRTVCGPRRASP
jgi:multidrug transporter EmrE-like cation transporter